MTQSPPTNVDVYLAPSDLDEALRRDVRAGLTSSPKSLPAKWHYDEHGSELFDQITRLEEYYPTEAERSILLANAADIVGRAQADTIIELGSGTSDKTRALLDAAVADGSLQRFVPFDVSEQFLRDACAALAVQYPSVAISGIVGDFDRHLVHLPSEGRRMVVFLGGTIGNYPPAERAELLATLVDGMSPGDHLLLGTDLAKAVDRMEAAYDDSQGVSSAFGKNVLSVMNRQLSADFDLDKFVYEAKWDGANEWIDMCLNSVEAHEATVADLDLTVAFAKGEKMRVEVSSKFRPEKLEQELTAQGLEVVTWYFDDNQDFGVSLSTLR